MSELDDLDRDVSSFALAADLESGLVPPGSRRGLTTQEAVARVSFSAIESDSDRDAATIAEELVAARLVLRQLLTEYTRGELTTEGRIRNLQELVVRGLAVVPGVPELVNETVGRVRLLLDDSAQRAGMRMVQEASAQGVTISADTVLDAASSAVLDQQANRLATTPQADALRALVEGIVPLPSTISPSEVLSTMQSVGDELSQSPLSRFARQAVSSATGLGRTAVAEASGAASEILASELLDRNTCSPCVQVDGKHYPSFAALREDYPSGIYTKCQGGLSCRGTPVVIYRRPSPT